MKLKDDIRPITYLKTHAAELVREIGESGRTVVITQNGMAKVVVMDVEAYDRWRTALAMLRMIAQSQAELDAGKGIPQADVLAAARRRLAERGLHASKRR